MCIYLFKMHITLEIMSAYFKFIVIYWNYFYIFYRYNLKPESFYSPFLNKSVNLHLPTLFSIILFSPLFKNNFTFLFEWKTNLREFNFNILCWNFKTEYFYVMEKIITFRIIRIFFCVTTKWGLYSSCLIEITYFF